MTAAFASHQTASSFYKSLFGCKIYKIALDAGCTCPTRDGTLGTKGCIFCSAGGSGEFAASRTKSISEQARDAIALVSKKAHGRSGTSPAKYIAYFQNFTNTYGDHDALEQKYKESLSLPDVVGISIATRPDCLDDDMVQRLARLSRQTFVQLELGLQTVNENTARYIRRGYETAVYDDAIARLKKTAHGLHVVTHVIFGLPGETEQDMLDTVKHAVAAGTDGIKFTVLYVLKGTDLAEDYTAGKFECLTEESYFSLLSKAITLLPENIVIHRLTGDGPKSLLIAPLWTANKRKVQNDLSAYFKKQGILLV